MRILRNTFLTLFVVLAILGVGSLIYLVRIGGKFRLKEEKGNYYIVYTVDMKPIIEWIAQRGE